MGTSTHAHRTLRFGVFDVDLRTAELRKHGVRIRLEEQPFHILALLVECPGELVTREELRRELWSADTFVDFDRSLNKAMSKLRLALGDSAESPRFIETLHRRGYRFIAPIQFEEPGEISGSSHGTNPALMLSHPPVSEIAGAPATTANSASGINQWKWTALLAVGLVALTVGGLTAFYKNPIAETAPKPVVPRRSVAVLGFKNLSGRADEAWVSTALSDWLTTELSAGEQLRTIPAESIARSKIELSLPEVDSLGKDNLIRIGKNLGSDFVVVGSYASLGKDSGGQVRLDLRLRDTRDGETVDAISETGTEAHIFELVADAGQHLRAKLGVGAVTSKEAAEVAGELPSNHDVARLYSEGLAKLHVFDALAARDSFQKAIALEPDYAPSHSALATAWSMLGYDEKAKTEAKNAVQLSASLPRAERLLVEGRYNEISRNWEKAIDIYRALVEFFPDSLDYGLSLAQAQVSAGKGKDALITVDSLKKLPSPLGDDPRIDLAEARAAESLGDYKRDLASCYRAAEKAHALGASLLFAEARESEAWALSNLGSPDEAVQAAGEARQIFQAADDQRGVARAINSVGIALESKGDTVGAKTMYEEALSTNRRIGNKLGLANELDDLGDVLLALGDLKAAREKYEESLATNEEIANIDGIALAKGALGVVLLAIGDHLAAERADQESVELCRSIGDREKAAIGLAGLGNTLRAEGNLEEAKKYELEAVATFDEIGDKQSSARFQLAVAELLIDQGNAAKAATVASRVAEAFGKSNAIRDESLASAVLARALLAQGRTSDAKTTIDRSLSLSNKYHDRQVELLVTITSARVRAADGTPADRTEAAARLQQVLIEATRTGFVNLAYEARLAAGEVEMLSGRRADAIAHFESLRKDAKDRGLGLIAQKAATAAQSM